MSTADVYRRLSPDRYNSYNIEPLLKALSVNDSIKAASLAANTLEFPVASLHPEINEIKRELSGAGAVSALMTGSGSAVFGLFPDLKKAEAAKERLKNKYPFVCSAATKGCGIEIV